MYLSIYLIILAWFLIALGAGYREAIMFHKESGRARRFKNKWKFDIHIWFTFLRAIPASLGLVFTYFHYDPIEVIYLAGTMIFTFPFLHDGMYYTKRELLKPGTYPDKWFDQSTQTTAIFSFTWYVRTLLFIVAMLFFTPW